MHDGEMLCGLGVQEAFVTKGALQQRLHLHGAEFVDGGVQVGPSLAMELSNMLDRPSFCPYGVVEQ